jgi:hypothetical protein
MADNPQPQPLTDEQIRQELQLRKDKTIELTLDFLSLQEALFAKGILTPDDMAEAVRLVTRKQKEALERVATAMHKKPSGTVQ